MATKGSAGIPILHNVYLNKLIDKAPAPPTLKFSTMFVSQQYPSDEIRWETVYGSGGMTPFVSPGMSAPTIAGDGMSQASAYAAYYKEKSFLDENVLNNLRQPGTYETHMMAKSQVLKRQQKLLYRCQRRREWMLAKMLMAGSFTYAIKGGANFTITYPSVPMNSITLTGNYVWGTGTSRNPVRDIFDVKRLMSEQHGMTITRVLMNSATLRLLLFDAAIQDLLKKSTFGDGQLFSNPQQVLPVILGLGNFELYDEFYDAPAWLTGPVVGGSTTVISVDDVSDFEIGGKARFQSYLTPGIWEEQTITAVDILASTITVGTAPVSSYKAGKDRVTMRKKFIADNQVLMYTERVDNQPIAEFMEAPFGMNRHYGRFADTNDEWDPDGIWMRIQDKGLPVLYYPEAIFRLTVA